jgi:putative transposase
MERKAMIEPGYPGYSLARQCHLLDVNRSSYYYEPVPVSEEDLAIMRALDELYTQYPFFGGRKMTVKLNERGFRVNLKRVRRLMKVLGIEAIYPKPNTSKNNPEHKIYPYLLRGVSITQPDQVWATDMTYIRMREGFIYLSAIIDWLSRYILAWDISIGMEAEFSVSVLKEALGRGKPGTFNSDQGSQYTSLKHTGVLEAHGIQISMDGRGRCFDNIFVERLWRTIKYEEVYLKEYETIKEARSNLKKYIEFYNRERPHQGLNYRTPESVYFQRSA